MNENTNPEVTAEETEVSSVEETTQENTEAVAEEAKTEESAETIENAEETAENIENTEDAENGESTEITDTAETETEAADEKPEKKKRLLQVPVIISLCIVILAILSYVVYTGFFLKEPEGISWSNEIDGATYYYEFGNDGTFNAYVGTVEVHSTYQKTKSDDGNSIVVGTKVGNFYNSAPATYEITGSRLLGNQQLTCSYGEEYKFTLDQANRKEVVLELPKDFTPNEDLIGSWIFKYMGYDIYRATFNKDGSMAMEFVQEGITYNGIYTLTDNTVNFTYYVAENYATPIDYSLDGDTLNFMGYTFVREGSEAAEATPDQQLMTPAN